MSERVPSVTEGTRIISDAVTLWVDNKIFDGWEDVKITRELNSAASDFQLQVTDKWQGDADEWRLKPGQHIHLHLGKSPVLTGYIDRVEASISAGSRSITVAGRSKTADLVDCSVEGSKFDGLTVKEVADKLCAPFGIRVLLLGNAGTAFQAIVVEQGETIFNLLDRLCREKKLLMYPGYNGELILSARGTYRVPTQIQQGVNLLSGKSTYDNANRFSKYVLKGNMMPDFAKALGAEVAATGQATDAGISRYRPLIIMAENATDNAGGEDRASYEAHLRAAKALTAEVSVQGWTQADGKLWEVNQVVFLDAGFLGIRRRMLIQKVDFNKSNAGTTCNLSLIREDAFDFGKKSVKKDDPLSWAKFVKPQEAWHTPLALPGAKK